MKLCANYTLLQAFRSFTPRAIDAWMVDDPLVYAMLERQVFLYPAIALPSVDDPAVFAGIVHNHRGAGELWMITGHGFKGRTPAIVAQLARQIVSTMVDTLGLHRLQMAIDSDRDDAKRFARKIGFEFEVGPMIGYGLNNKNHDFFTYRKER